MAALTYAGLLLIGPLGALWLFRDSSRSMPRRALRVALFGLGAALLIAPVTLRNYRASGEWVLISTNGGITCYQGNNPNAVGVFSTPPGFSGRITEQRDESRRLAEAERGTSMGDQAISSFYFRKAFAFLADDPVHSAGLIARKFLLALANEEQPLEYNQRLDFNPFRWLFPVPFAMIMALAVARYVGRREHRGSRAEGPILVLLVTELVVMLVFYVSGRYRLPATPGLIAVAGCGLVLLWRCVKSNKRLALPMAATVVVLTALSLAYVPLTRGDLRDQQIAMGYIDRAAAFWDNGRRDEAIETMRLSLALDPVFAERHLSLARILHQAGRTDEAESAVREAIDRDPNSVEALFLYGVLCVEQRRLEEAARVFADVLRRAPTNENAANNLLGVLTHLGRSDEALELWRTLRERGVPIDPTLDDQMRGEFARKD